MATKSTTPRVVQLAQIRDMAASGEAKQIRLARNLSLNELAADVGVGTTTLYRWEEGHRRPRGDAALTYLRILLELKPMAAA